MASVVMLGADEGIQLEGLRSFARRQKRRVKNVAKDAGHVTASAGRQVKKGNVLKAGSIAVRGAASGAKNTLKTVAAPAAYLADVMKRKIERAIKDATGKWLKTKMKAAGAAALRSDACKNSIRALSVGAGAAIGAAVGAMGLGVSAAVTTPIAMGLVPLTVSAIWDKTKREVLAELDRKPSPAPVANKAVKPIVGWKHPLKTKPMVKTAKPSPVAAAPKKSSLAIPAAAALLFLL